jgi:hypothetical protein
MKPGDYVLDLLKGLPKNKRTIALVRHSVRNSFEGIPGHLRDRVEITPEGVSLARAFGESLGEIFSGKFLFLGHTSALRCRMTAESIGDGYFPADHVQMLGCRPDITSPVVNPDKCIELLSEPGWSEGMKKWLNKEMPGDTLQNPQTYADEILKKLLSFPETGETDLLVVVAHDITLFPIVSCVFGKKITKVEFLNGIVIAADTMTAEFRYADAQCSLMMIRDIF